MIKDISHLLVVDDDNKIRELTKQYLEENNLVPPLYQQINLQSQDIGEFYDKGLIRNGEAYIDMTNPNFPKLTVFRIADFD